MSFFLLAPVIRVSWCKKMAPTAPSCVPSRWIAHCHSLDVIVISKPHEDWAVWLTWEKKNSGGVQFSSRSILEVGWAHGRAIRRWKYPWKPEGRLTSIQRHADWQTDNQPSQTTGSDNHSKNASFTGYSRQVDINFPSRWRDRPNSRITESRSRSLSHQPSRDYFSLTQTCTQGAVLWIRLHASLK